MEYKNVHVVISENAKSLMEIFTGYSRKIKLRSPGSMVIQSLEQVASFQQQIGDFNSHVVYFNTFLTKKNSNLSSFS